MVTSAITFAVKNLSILIQKEVGLVLGVDKEMKRLSSTLSTILAVLDDAEMKQHQDKAIQDWLRKLKDAAYEVGDILDQCHTQALKAPTSGSLKKVWTSAMTCYPVENILFRHNIANRMKEVIKDINAIAEERNRFHLNEGVIEKDLALADDSRETSSSLPPLEVFGRQDDIETIVKVLTEEVCDLEELSFYPIIGMGGLGKTTLAQMTFNDERISSHFVLKIWVYVSQKFDVKRVMKEIIESTSGETCEASSLDSLHKKLREMLSMKRYLLVLDDAWSDDLEEWDKLKHALSCGLPGACVLVTTRSEKVASVVGTLPPHRLSYLSEDDCWFLFRQRAFGPVNEERPDLIAIGKEIVKKCGGVPLAAKSLGGLMRFRRGEKEWINIRESDLWNVPEGDCSILPALRLSYYNLPLELRHCFSYCAVFLKGSEIEKDKLIQLWMAHGLISSKDKIEVEDVGNAVWNELNMRSIFQDEQRGWGGRIYFKMHDLMHDLAQSVMGHECHLMEGENSGIALTRRFRHAILVDTNSYRSAVFPKTLNKHRSLHTILLHHRDISGDPGYEYEPDTYCDLKSFSSLRAFDANGAILTHLSASIANLKHLRYLTLSRTSIKELPASICDLHNLQTLDLNHCYRLRRLPKKMKRLRGLRHLCLVSCEEIRGMPLKLGKLTQLKTLSLFVVGKRSGRRLSELQHLDLGGQLEIRHLERVRSSMEAKELNLARKHNLRIVTLSWDCDAESATSLESRVEQQEEVIGALEPHPNIEELTIEDYGGKQYPAWMGNASVLRNVVKIFLFGCSDCLGLPALGQLPCLKLLHLAFMMKVEYIIQNANNNNNFTGGGHGTSVGEYLSLETLIICSLPKLKGLSMDEEDQQQQLLPRLQGLVVGRCPQLTLPKLPALKRLTIDESSIKTLTSIAKLTSLTSLSFNRNEDVIRFPEDMFQSLTLLQTLKIQRFRKLKEFPESMSSLTALKEWHIEDCKELKFLPDSIQTLTQLQKLVLKGCSPELESRCEKGNGQDWYKIAHVPQLYIN